MDRSLRSASLMTRLLIPPEPTHSLISTCNGSFNPQSTCFLFAVIPPEIRHRIFSFALYSYDVTSRPYPEHSYYSRPGYRHHQRISTNLLVTCRRIYRETHDLAVSLNEHVFWCSSTRGPLRKFFDNPKWYFSKMTIEQRAAVTYVHLFTQLYWLERSESFKIFCELEDIHLKRLKITVSHTDWWFWELNTPLAMKHHWVSNFESMKKLKILDIELETMERDKDQMETIVSNMIDKCTVRAGSRTLTTQGNKIATERYMGQAVYKYDWDTSAEESIYYSKQDNRWVTGKPPEIPAEIPYIVTTIRWTTEISV